MRCMLDQILRITNKTLFARVALPIPLHKCFDYLIPHSQTQVLQEGMRVQVPFNKQILIGIVIAILDKSTIHLTQIKPILNVLDDLPLIPQSLQQLLHWANQYYQHPLGLVFKAALPKLLRQGKPATTYQITYWRLVTISNKISQTTNTHKQDHLLKLLQQNPEGLSEKLLNRQGYPQNIRNQLAKKGLIVSFTHSANISSHHQPGISSGIVLNSAQQRAISTIESHLHGFHCFLLDGVTGSGKTEVYLRLIHTVIQQNKQVLVLIPEIGLMPKTLYIFQQRFTVPIAVLHSRLNDKERLHVWLQARSGDAQIIIGTRSASLIPLKKPGLYIIDEEHDSSFKQQEGFRYSGRDLLIRRAQLDGCSIVLGSATPSLESALNASTKRYHHLHLPNRAKGTTNSHIQILDIRHKNLEQGLSLQLLTEIRKHLSRHEQILLFLNRRGYAPVLMCHDCGWTQSCPHCDANMIIHSHQTPILMCHHCQSKKDLPISCPICLHHPLNFIGMGTERLEQILQKHFPKSRILRVDKDTTQSKHAMRHIVEKITNDSVEIFITTQIFSKGHHLPKLRLIAILDIDSALFSSDFRSTERMGQLITQVAGQANRNNQTGHVILQTHHPEHPLLTTLITNGYASLTRMLLLERQTATLPPFSYQILFRAHSHKPLVALKFLQQLKMNATKLNLASHIQLLGPIPAPIEKQCNTFRAQLLLTAKKRTQLHKLCKQLVVHIKNSSLRSSINWSIDIDPIEMC